jgi:hypothetical protein
MLADQFLAAIAAVRTVAEADELARKLWRAHAEGLIADADAEAIGEAVEAQRATLAGGVTGRPLRAASGPPRACAGSNASLPPERRIVFRVGIHLGDGDPMGDGVNIAARRRRREKVFGPGRPRALDRNAKVRIMHWARCLSRRTEKGRAYGPVTAKALAVLEALLWAFHNAKSGLCFPSYERIAEAAHCARSTVAEALKALEDAGVLSWVQRIKRVRERCPDLLGDEGWRWRVLRTSNAYAFTDPSPVGDRPNSSKSEKPTGTANQALPLTLSHGPRETERRLTAPQRAFRRGKGREPAV